MNFHYAADTIFAHLLIDKLDYYEINKVINYIKDKDYTLLEIYNKWLAVREQVLEEITPGKIKEYCISNIPMNINVDRDEWLILKLQIQRDDIKLLERISFIALIEATHLEDELSR